MSESSEFAPTIIKRPFIPFCEIFPRGAQIGSCVIVKGRVPRYANQFSINLIVGQNIQCYVRNGSDIALHFSPHFEDDGVVIKNSRICYRWGIEERQRKAFPFARNSWFEVQILVKASYFKIFVDGQQFTLFLHRIPPHHIGMFSVEGDVEVESIVFDRFTANKSLVSYRDSTLSNGDISTRKTPSPTKFLTDTEVKQQIDHNFNIYASQHSIVDNMALSQKTIYNPPLPFSHSITNGLKTGMNIIISAQTKPSAEQFSLSFQCGANDGVPDVALCLMVLFNKSSFVRKSRINGEWTNEEKQLPFFPFKNSKQEYFELKIKLDSNSFIISIFGKHLTEYVTPITDLETVNTLEIDGDINVLFVKIDASEVN